MIITILLWLNIFVVNTFSLWFKSVHQVLFIHQKLLSEVKKLSSNILYKKVNVLLCYCSKIQKNNWNPVFCVQISISDSTFTAHFCYEHACFNCFKTRATNWFNFPLSIFSFYFHFTITIFRCKKKVNTFLIHFSATHSPYSDKLQRYCLYIGTAGHSSLKPGILMSFIIFLA